MRDHSAGHARPGNQPHRPPFDPATSRLFPRSRSSAAARQRQARSSSPAPWTGALTLRALQLDSRPRGGTTTGTYEESQRNSPTPGPTTTAGHWARSPCSLDREFPHGWRICGRQRGATGTTLAAPTRRSVAPRALRASRRLTLRSAQARRASRGVLYGHPGNPYTCSRHQKHSAVFLSARSPPALSGAAP